MHSMTWWRGATSSRITARISFVPRAQLDPVVPQGWCVPKQQRVCHAYAPLAKDVDGVVNRRFTNMVLSKLTNENGFNVDALSNVLGLTVMKRCQLILSCCKTIMLWYLLRCHKFVDLAQSAMISLVRFPHWRSHLYYYGAVEQPHIFRPQTLWEVVKRMHRPSSPVSLR